MTMMDVGLTIDHIARRAEQFSGVEIVSRRPDRSLHRSTYGAMIARARKLSRALIAGGIRKGDRVATLMWNHVEHLEAYFAIPLAGAVTHTLNLRLAPSEIAFIASHGRDRIVIVDDVLLPLLAKVIAAGAKFERIIVVGNADEHESYEGLLASARDDIALPVLVESDPLGTCYTSGTTGDPKGVVYTHRSTVLHTLVAALPDQLGLVRADTLLPVVPMFHVNAWGLPFIATMVGAKLVFPGPFLDPPSLLDLMASERVTFAAGVPTIWIGIREALDAAPGKWQLLPNVQMIVGGAAVPEKLIRDFDRLGLRIVHAWGMTETSPIGLVSRLSPELAALDQAIGYKLRAKQGVPPPLLDLRVVGDQGDVAHDDQSSGEVLVRGPWIADEYTEGLTPERWTSDGYFRTGDVATVDSYGFVRLVDRVADLIKSGGEWIASATIETALMDHPAVREAAVIGVPDAKWSERPIAVVAFKPGASATPEEMRAFLAERFPKFWLPDAFEVIDAIPRTSTGKFQKTELRKRYRG